MAHAYPRRTGGGAPLTQRERQRCAPVDLSVRADVTAVPADDALDDGQPDSGASIVLLRMQPLKDAKEMVCMPRVKADAVIPDRIQHLAAIGSRGLDLD